MSKDLCVPKRGLFGTKLTLLPVFSKWVVPYRAQKGLVVQRCNFDVTACANWTTSTWQPPLSPILSPSHSSKYFCFFYNVIIVKSISQISTPGPMHDVLCDHLGPPHLLLTWHQKRFLDKLNPPSLSSSLFGWERCQESPHKFSKLGHCRILRKHTLCT